MPVIAITAKAASGLVSSSNDRKHRSADGLQVIIVSCLSGLVGAGDIAATSRDFALRLTAGRLPEIATWSVYPSIAAVPINPGIDVMCQKQKKGAGSAALLESMSTLPVHKPEIGIHSPLVLTGDRAKWRHQQFDAPTF